MAGRFRITRATLSPLSPGPRAAGRVRATAPGPADPPWLHGLLWLLAAALAAFTIRRAVSPHDEGLMLQAGARIAAGQWPYRDFWTNYPPGQATLLAGLDELLGVSLLSWRIVWALVAATTSGLAYALLRAHGAPRRGALLAWLAVAGAMAWPSTPEPNPTALMLAFAALLAAPRRPLLAGALAGLAIFFRLEIGGAAALGVLVLAGGDGRDGGRERARALAAAVAVAAAALGPFLVVDPGAMVHDTLGFLAIQGDQRLPFPLAGPGTAKPDKLLEYYVPLILLVAAALGALAAVARGRATSRLTIALVPLVVVGVLYLLARTDEFHLLPLSAVLAVALIAPPTGAAAEWPLRAALVAAVALIAVAGLDRRAGQALHPPAAAAVPGPAGDGVRTTPADARALRALRRDVDRLVAPGAPIFVGDRTFTRVRVGDPLLYVLLGHPNPTRYDVMQPGLVTTARVQREIVGSLRASDTRVIVRWLAATAEPTRDDGGDAPEGSRLLDRWIAAHYRPSTTVGDYRVLVRR